MSDKFDSKAFDPANFNFGAFAQIAPPALGLFGNPPAPPPPGKNPSGNQPPGNAPPFGAPPIPPTLAENGSATNDLLKQIFDLLNGKMQTDLHTCANNPSGLLQ